MDLNQAPPLAPYVDTPRLAELAQQQVKKALDAFVSTDLTKAEEVLKGDDLLDALFLKIFNELLAYMMEDSKNIRRATALMFIAKHLERIGDHAMNVAEMVIYMVRGKDIRHPRAAEPAGVQPPRLRPGPPTSSPAAAPSVRRPRVMSGFAAERCSFVHREITQATDDRRAAMLVVDDDADWRGAPEALLEERWLRDR